MPTAVRTLRTPLRLKKDLVKFGYGSGASTENGGLWAFTWNSPQFLKEPSTTACPYCGETCPEGAKFCPKCGKPLPDAADKKPASKK